MMREDCPYVKRGYKGSTDIDGLCDNCQCYYNI